MATHLVRPTNGVSFAVKHVCTTQDGTDNNVLLDFQVDYDLVANVIHTNTSGVGKAMTGVTVTYTAAGQVNIAATITAGDILHVVANRDYNSSNPY